jgi:hypothetical protein
MERKVYSVGDCTRLAWVSVEMTDLWNDCGGWSGNYSWVRRARFAVVDTISDRALSRRILKSVGASNCGFKVGGWLGGTMDWRQGCIGIAADWVS